MIKILSKILVAAFGVFIFAGCSGSNPAGNDIPDAPTNLSGEATGAYSIQLYWADNSENEDVFLLYRSVGGPYELTAELDANTDAYNDQINFSCVEVGYYIVASNGAGNSSNSNFINVPLLCGPENSDTLSLPFAR